VATFILSNLVPLRRRGLWQGLGNVILGAGSGLGGFFGGWINDTMGWRPAFALQIPISLLAVVLIYFTLKNSYR
jgi:MFS family permease